jgi:hypothetical protein
MLEVPGAARVFLESMASNMRSLEDIIARAKRLSAKDRRRLLNALTPSAKEGRRSGLRKAKRPANEPYRSLLRLAGKAHVDATDIASDKYRYVAAAYGDERDG